MGRSAGSFLGFVGYAVGSSIEEEVRSSIDKKVEEQLKSILGDFDPKKVMEKRLHHYMQLTKIFVTENVDQNVLEGEKLDGVLEVTVEEWGLRSCTCPDPTKQVQVGLNVHGGMVLLKDRSTVGDTMNSISMEGAKRCIFKPSIRVGWP